MFKGEILYVLSRERDREQITGVPDGVKIVGRAMTPRDQDFSVIPEGSSGAVPGGRGAGEQLAARRARPRGRLRPATGRA